MRLHRAALLLQAAALIGCGREPAPVEAPADELTSVQVEVAQAVLPAVVRARETVEAIAPTPPVSDCVVHPKAVELIVEFEVVSPAYYSMKLEAPIWPGGQSGVTWGVGYDGGHQTRARIGTDWSMHAQVERLLGTAGVIGAPAKALAPGMRDVHTPYPLAAQVFTAAMLPPYCELARRTFRDGWDRIPWVTQGAIVATVFNRGAAMGGESRREMRVIRDECVPAGDAACVAAQLRAMPRLWIGKDVEEGLRRRYLATAALAEINE